MNNSRMFLGLMSFALALAPSLAKADDALVNVARTFKVGEVSRYTSTINTSIMGMDIVATTPSKTTVKEIKKEPVADITHAAPVVTAPVENYNSSIFNLLDDVEEPAKSEPKIAAVDDSKNWPVVDFGQETTGGTRSDSIEYIDKSEVSPFGLARLATENELKKYNLASAKSTKSDPEPEENELETEIGESILTEILASSLGVNSAILDVAKQLIGEAEAIKSDPKSEPQPTINQNQQVKKLTKKERLAKYENEQE